jgi:hypothetical protein
MLIASARKKICLVLYVVQRKRVSTGNDIVNGVRLKQNNATEAW